MTDTVSREKRSEIMASITSTGTKPEQMLCSMVSDILGEEFPIERNVKDLPGKPDILVPPLGLVIFVDGCFFHCCPEHGHIPKSNEGYWRPKLAGNVRRDRKNCRRLRYLGHSVWRFWEHCFKTKSNCLKTYHVLSRRLERSYGFGRGSGY